MKKYFVCAVLLTVLGTFPAASLEKNFGVGFAYGEPSAIAARWWMTERVALDGTFSWSAVDRDVGEYAASLDLLFHTFGIFGEEAEGGWRLPLYVGLGAQVTRDVDTVFGIRLPIGLTFIPQAVPIDLFAEVGPVMQLGDGPTFIFTAGIGFLLYFF